MKQMKKLTCLLLSLLMVLSLGITALAAEGDDEPAPLADNTEKGSVTINGALNGNTFTLYQIFGLESYDTDTNAYLYTIKSDNPLYDTVNNMTLQVGSMTAPEKAFTLTAKPGTTDTYYVELSTTFKNAPNDGETVKKIASNLMTAIGLSDTAKNSLMKAQIKNLGITGQTDTSKNEQKTGNVTTTAVDDNKSNITFADLDLGYYLIDSSAGAMIGLTTTAPDATIAAKNKLPNAVKEVKQTNNNWGKENTKQIGEPVEYRVQIAVEEGAKNYVLYDSLSAGITFDKITKVYYGNASDPIDEHIVYDRSDIKDVNGNVTGTKNTGALADFCNFEENVSYTTKDSSGNPITKTCRFKMTFKDDFLQQVLNDPHKDDVDYSKVIYVEYSGKLNANAVIGAAPGSTGNPNDIYLTYGDNDVEVSHDTVTTYTYKMELVKHKEDKKILEGAQFEVYHTQADANASTNKISFVKEADKEDGKDVYRVAADGETGVTTIEAGDVIIKGLGGSFATGASTPARTYFFKEIKAPDGYTLIPAPVEFTITNNDDMATFEADGTYQGNGLGVENKAGTLLPSTGGIGTTLFYILGGVLVAAAGVLLVTKKRMSAER